MSITVESELPLLSYVNKFCFYKAKNSVFKNITRSHIIHWHLPDFTLTALPFPGKGLVFSVVLFTLMTETDLLEDTTPLVVLLAGADTTPPRRCFTLLPPVVTVSDARLPSDFSLTTTLPVQHEASHSDLWHLLTCYAHYDFTSLHKRYQFYFSKMFKIVRVYDSKSSKPWKTF